MKKLLYHEEGCTCVRPNNLMLNMEDFQIKILWEVLLLSYYMAAKLIVSEETAVSLVLHLRRKNREGGKWVCAHY